MEGEPWMPDPSREGRRGLAVADGRADARAFDVVPRMVGVFLADFSRIPGNAAIFRTLRREYKPVTMMAKDASSRLTCSRDDDATTRVEATARRRDPGRRTVRAAGGGGGGDDAPTRRLTFPKTSRAARRGNADR